LLAQLCEDLGFAGIVGFRLQTQLVSPQAFFLGIGAEIRAVRECGDTSGLLGILIAYGGIKSIARYLPDGTFPGEASFELSLPVLLFSTTVAVLTGIVFGAWPAIQASSPRLNRLLPSKGRGLTGGKGARRSHNLLIAGQVALTVILLSAAGATVRALYGLMHVPLGYDPHNVAWITVPLRDGTHGR